MIASSIYLVTVVVFFFCCFQDGRFDVCRMSYSWDLPLYAVN